MMARKKKNIKTHKTLKRPVMGVSFNRSSDSTTNESKTHKKHCKRQRSKPKQKKIRRTAKEAAEELTTSINNLRAALEKAETYRQDFEERANHIINEYGGRYAGQHVGIVRTQSESDHVEVMNYEGGVYKVDISALTRLTPPSPSS